MTDFTGKHPTKEELDKCFNYLIAVFKKADELQIYRGDKSSDNVYERMAYREEYMEYHNMVYSIKDIFIRHKYDLNKIFNTVLDPKLQPNGKHNLVIGERHLLPEKIKGFRKIKKDALTELGFLPK